MDLVSMWIYFGSLFGALIGAVLIAGDTEDDNDGE